ncbi:hypothetical protein IAU60_002285 [Kwoniella sp. DSM 27419]
MHGTDQEGTDQEGSDDDLILLDEDEDEDEEEQHLGSRIYPDVALGQFVPQGLDSPETATAADESSKAMVHHTAQSLPTHPAESTHVDLVPSLVQVRDILSMQNALLKNMSAEQDALKRNIFGHLAAVDEVITDLATITEHLVAHIDCRSIEAKTATPSIREAKLLAVSVMTQAIGASPDVIESPTMDGPSASASFGTKSSSSTASSNAEYPTKPRKVTRSQTARRGLTNHVGPLVASSASTGTALGDRSNTTFGPGSSNTPVERHTAMETSSGSVTKRTFNGITRLRNRCSVLNAGDGDVKVEEAIWPKKREGTVVGLLYTVKWVHWACAGFDEEYDLAGEEWTCPDCLANAQRSLLRANRPSRLHSPSGHMQQVGLRDEQHIGSRLRKKVLSKPGDDELFVIDKIIGMREVPSNHPGRKAFQYLVKWYDWPVESSTWEPKAHIPRIKGLLFDFHQEAAEAGVDVRQKVVLLPAAQDLFVPAEQ